MAIYGGSGDYEGNHNWEWERGPKTYIQKAKKLAESDFWLLKCLQKTYIPGCPAFNYFKF